MNYGLIIDVELTFVVKQILVLSKIYNNVGRRHNNFLSVTVITFNN